MQEAHVSVLPIYCTLSAIALSSLDEDSQTTCTAIRDDDAISLSINVKLHGPGAVALLPLAPLISVEFYAKPMGVGDDVMLGRAETQAIAHLSSYTLTLPLHSARDAGLQAGSIYRVGALVRIGSPDGPSLVNGFIESLVVEVYTRPPDHPDSADSIPLSGAHTSRKQGAKQR